MQWCISMYFGTTEWCALPWESETQSLFVQKLESSFCNASINVNNDDSSSSVFMINPWRRSVLGSCRDSRESCRWFWSRGNEGRENDPNFQEICSPSMEYKIRTLASRDLLQSMWLHDVESKIRTLHVLSDQDYFPSAFPLSVHYWLRISSISSG